MTTHSPQVIGEVEARCVRLLSWANRRVVVNTPAMALGTDSNWILSVLMDANEMDKDVEEKLAVISHLISEMELNVAECAIEELRDNIGNTVAIQRLSSTIERIKRLGK